MSNFYIYVHFRKDNLQPFYVGKGKGKRHLSKQSRNPHWRHIVNKVGYMSQIMENNLTEEQSFIREKYYIEVLGRENLCNYTDGGEGTTGYKWNNIQKNKLSIILKGKDKEGKRIKVIDISNNKIFDSIKIASQDYKINYRTLVNYLNGSRKNKTNLRILQCH